MRGQESGMHIVIGVISAIAGLIWALVALQRAGFDVGSCNPVLWRRRAQWRKKYAEKPIYTLTEPLDLAALLLLGTAKCEGEVSTEQKQELRNIFTEELKLNAGEADDLLVASAHLMRDEIYLVDHLPQILEKSSSKFSAEQLESLLGLMHRIAEKESPINEEQEKLITATADYFRVHKKAVGTW